MEEKYNNIRIVNFIKYEKCPCDIFITLSGTKFIKVLNKSDHIDQRFLDNYLNKNIIYFYILSKDYHLLKSDLFSLSNPVENKSLDNINNKQLNEYAKSIGVDSSTIDRAEISSKKVINTLVKDKTLSLLIDKMIVSEDRFLYDHIYLLGIIACKMGRSFDWWDSKSREKITFAAMIHDSYLNTPHMKNNFSHSAIHLPQVLNKIKENSTVSSDIIKIVENLYNFNCDNVTPLQAIFSISHQFILELYKIDLDQKALLIALEETSQMFSSNNSFSKYVNILKEMLNCGGINGNKTS
jgi:hypothetical protein